MQQTHRTILLGLLAAAAFSAPGWSADPAAKSAADDLSKGYQAARRGYWQEAMARYEHASRKAPGNAEVWSNFAVSLEAVGRWADAGDAYRRALEIDPRNSKIQQNVILYNEFYATYIAREDQKKADSEEKSNMEEAVAAEAAGDASKDDAASDDSTAEGADDATQS